MKMFSTTILLSVSILLIAIGIHIDNLILVGIGGFLVGVYNSMIHNNIKGEINE